MKKIVLYAILLPVFSFGQPGNAVEAYYRLQDSISASLQCNRSGFATNTGNIDKSTLKICCAYHTKEAYDSFIVRQERLAEIETDKPKKPGGNETYCDQFKKCHDKIYQQKQSVIEKLWKEYNDGLKKSGERFDAAYNPTVEKLKAQCFLKWDPNTGITRQCNYYAPSLIALKLNNYQTCLLLAIALTNNLQKIYGEMEEACNSQVMGNNLLTPLCNNVTWDPANLYATITELYETIKFTVAKECGQPLKIDDCCTVIPYKNGQN